LIVVGDVTFPAWSTLTANVVGLEASLESLSSSPHAATPGGRDAKDHQ
jgi:hypothetical protein